MEPLESFNTIQDNKTRYSVMEISRRQLLATASSTLLLAGGVGCSASRRPYRLLDDEQAATLTALCEQIIPTDETPGAAWAHVVKFIDRQLVYHYQQHVAGYRTGLSGLNRAALAQFRSSFAELPFDTQTELVAAMEKGELGVAEWSAGDQKAFFRTVRDHTMQGYYGDPRHGGNRDLVSWRALGVPHPPVRGRDDYRFPKEGRSAVAPSQPAVEGLR
jgi:gluconate 2-dehydrogenase gamma chain